MQNSWRSWFWNIMLMVGMLLMSVAMAASASESTRYVAAGFDFAAVICAVGAIRSLMVGVSARPHGIIMRGLTHTTTIRWGEIEEITSDAQTSGVAGALGATTPVVIRRRHNGKKQRVELNALGGYGVSPVRPTPADRAIAALNEYLDRWRKEHDKPL